MISEISFVLCELRGYLSCFSCIFFRFELIWKGSSNLDDRALKYSEALTKPGSSSWAFQCAIQSQSQRVAVFPGKGYRGKLSSSCFRKEVLKILFFFFPGNQGNQVKEVWKLLKGFSESYFILFRKSQAMKKARNKKHSATTLRRGLLVWKLL